MKRLDLKTGFVCNNNCLFCVQADNKFKGNRSLSDLKSDLLDARKRCNSVVLTGGEVTIRPDFFELVKYAKDLGYEKIQIQTNGRMFSDMDFCKKTVLAGATEFSPAIHGYCAEQHDYLTRSKGSFAQTIKGIRNLKKLKQNVLTNTVVVEKNYEDLPKIAKLLIKLDVDQFQFAFVHPICNAWINRKNLVPKISKAAPFIKRGLQMGIDKGKNVMAEAMPYCLMKNYEEYISESFIPSTEIKGEKHQNIDFYEDQRKNKGKIKFEKCKSCKYNIVCEGPWKEYFDVFGEEEFVPIK